MNSSCKISNQRSLLTAWLFVLTIAAFNCIASTLPTIPVPGGFVEGSGTSEKLEKMGLAGQLPGVKLLGVYCEPKTLAEILTVGYTQPAPFGKALLKVEYISEADAVKGFATLVRNAKQEGNAKFDPNSQATKKIFEHYEKAGRDPDTGLSAKIAGMTFLGSLLETSNVLAEAAIVNLKWSNAGSDTITPYAVAMAFMRLGKQQVDLLVAYPLRDETTLTNANEKLLVWIDAIEKSNRAEREVLSQRKQSANGWLDIKRLMSKEELTASGISKLSEDELTALNAWLGKHTLAVADALAQKSKADLRKSSAAVSFEDLLGCAIVGDDSEFLGVISESTVDSKSILNTVGRFGSSVSSTSIFNTVSRYGSTVSNSSAFNDIASKPPSIFSKEGKFVAYLTKNELKTPRVDPTALIGWLKSK